MHIKICKWVYTYLDQKLMLKLLISNVYIGINFINYKVSTNNNFTIYGIKVIIYTRVGGDYAKI